MSFGTVGLVAVLVLTIPGVVRAQSNETPSLVIRTYNWYPVSSESLRVAQDAAAAVLRDAGIDVRWLDCGGESTEPSGEPSRCGLAPAANELLLRIQANGPVRGNGNVSMGFSVVGRRPEYYAPFLFTVFADVVALVARDAGIDDRRLLGYAVAHEIGHLLLNNPRHSNAGLMRALWSRSELQKSRAADWMFLVEEAETMRLAIDARRP